MNIFSWQSFLCTTEILSFVHISELMKILEGQTMELPLWKSSPVVSQINKDSSEDPCPWRIPGKVNQSKNKTICNKLLIWSSISFGSKFVMRVKPLWLNYLCALDTCSGCEPNHKRKGRQPGFGNITNKDFNLSLLNRTIRYHQQEHVC